MTTDEMQANGYKAVRHGDTIRVSQNGESVAILSPLYNGKMAFDWHRRDQWHLHSSDVVALLKIETGH